MQRSRENAVPCYTQPRKRLHSVVTTLKKCFSDPENDSHYTTPLFRTSCYDARGRVSCQGAHLTVCPPGARRIAVPTCVGLRKNTAGTTNRNSNTIPPAVSNAPCICSHGISESYHSSPGSAITFSGSGSTILKERTSLPIFSSVFSFFFDLTHPPVFLTL